MTDTTTNDKKTKAVAKHELIYTEGGEHTSIELATGIRYTDLASGEKFEYMIPNAAAGAAMTMLALFGAKTKATNEASRIRNGEGGGPAEQMEAIDEVFGNITNGVWREKAEGGGGTRTDKALLATVLVEMLGDKAVGTVDTYQNRLETDDKYYKAVWASEVKTEYNKRVGKTGPALATLI